MSMDPATYDAWYQTARGRWVGDTEYRLLRRELAPSAGESILDAGCGTGYFSRRFALSGHPVVGIDFDRACVGHARMSLSPRLATAVADMECLPFPDRSFDCVIAVTSLCFVRDEARAIGEILRVASRRVALGLLNRDSLLYREKRRDAGGYAGAVWHSVADIAGLFAGLPICDLRVRTAILLPGGGIFARTLERLAPAVLPWGALIVVTCGVAPEDSCRV